MGEFATMAGEILSAVLPASDVGKLLWLVIVGWFSLVLTGRFRLEWIGRVVRHISGWVLCKIRGRHRYLETTIIESSGNMVAAAICRYCDKRHPRT